MCMLCACDSNRKWSSWSDILGAVEYKHVCGWTSYWTPLSQVIYLDHLKSSLRIMLQVDCCVFEITRIKSLASKLMSSRKVMLHTTSVISVLHCCVGVWAACVSVTMPSVCHKLSFFRGCLGTTEELNFPRLLWCRLFRYKRGTWNIKVASAVSASAAAWWRWSEWWGGCYELYACVQKTGSV